MERRVTFDLYWRCGYRALLASSFFSVPSLAFVLLFFAVFRGLDSLGLPFLMVSERYIEAGVPTWLVFVAISIAPAVWEELAFRGVIQTRLAGVLTQTEAWIFQAALFSVLHLSPMIFITHFGMGLMFGWLRDRSNSIYPGMLLHAAWNAVVVVDELNLALWTLWSLLTRVADSVCRPLANTRCDRPHTAEVLVSGRQLSRVHG